MEAERVPNPERLFRADIADGEFAGGEDRGYWRLRSIEWPCAVIEVTAAPRAGAPESFGFRFELTGYLEAPTAQLWDVEADAPLEPTRWPAGGPRHTAAFNPGWRTDAIYIPMDRLALEGHDPWKAMHTAYLWDSGRDITQYVRLLHGMLTEEGYTGVRG